MRYWEVRLKARIAVIGTDSGQDKTWNCMWYRIVQVNTLVLLVLGRVPRFPYRDAELGGIRVTRRHTFYRLVRVILRFRSANACR